VSQLFLNHRIKPTIDLVKLFIQNGLNIDQKDTEGNTILHHLALERCMDGFYSKMKILLELGADPHIRNDLGLRPIDLIPEKSCDLLD